MGSCITKVSPNKKHQINQYKESINEETVREMEPIKEIEEDEEVESYLEIEDEPYPQNIGAADMIASPENQIQSCSLFGGRSKPLRKSNDLYAKISKFSYQLPDNKTLLNSKYSCPIFTKSIIENKAPTTINHKMNYSESSNETFSYEFVDKFMKTLGQIEFDRSVPLIIDLNGVKHRLDISSASQIFSTDMTGNDRYCQTFCNYRDISIEKCIDIPPNSNVEIQAYQEKLEKVIIPFSAELVIFRRKGKKEFSGESIKKYFKKLNLTLLSVDEHSITIEVNGNLRASISLETVFTVNAI